MKTTTNFYVSYSQLALFDPSLARPLNAWSDKHVMQGFSWRPGSVSFRSLVESGKHNVEVEVVDHLRDPHPEAVRVIDAPIDVPDTATLEVGSVTETVLLSLPAGPYLLRCEFLRGSDAGYHRARLTFAKRDNRHFAVVLADPDLKVEGELLVTAEPA